MAVEIQAAASGIGQEQVIQAGGRTWKLSRLTHAVMLDFMAWARTKVPDPLDVALRVVDKLPEKVATELVREAMEKSLVFLNQSSPEMQSVMNSFEGNTRMLWSLLRTHHPDATESDAWDLANALQLEDETEADAKARTLDELVGLKKITRAERDRQMEEFRSRPSRVNRLMETSRGRSLGNGEAPAVASRPG